MYAEGSGVERDETEAVVWINQAVTQGHVEAMEWVRMMAEEGNAAAQLTLGGMYFSGSGVEEDAAEGIRWWRLAADQGHPPAQTGLGGRYFNGRGVPKDEVEAALWYRMAAEQGDAEVLAWMHLTAEEGSVAVQGNLGEMYADGRGVVPDAVQAHLWLSLAVARGSEEQRNAYSAARDTVAQRMTRDQIADAQRLAREWEAAHPREP
jgi:TPR repeat protein